MSNITTVCVTKGGQYLQTTPKSIAMAMGLKKGDKVEFKITAIGVVMEKV